MCSGTDIYLPYLKVNGISLITLGIVCSIVITEKC